MKKKLILTIGEIMFVAVVPFVMLTFNFVSWESGIVAKVGIGGIMGLFLVYYAIKRMLLDKYILRLRTMSTQHLADYKVETDELKKLALAEVIATERTIEAFLNFVIPFLLFVAFYIVCIVLEKQLATLSTTLIVIGSSEIVGFVFSIFSARTI